MGTGKRWWSNDRLSYLLSDLIILLFRPEREARDSINFSKLKAQLAKWNVSSLKLSLYTSCWLPFSFSSSLSISIAPSLNCPASGTKWSLNVNVVLVIVVVVVVIATFAAFVSQNGAVLIKHHFEALIYHTYRDSGWKTRSRERERERERENQRLAWRQLLYTN